GPRRVGLEHFLFGLGRFVERFATRTLRRESAHEYLLLDIDLRVGKQRLQRDTARAARRRAALQLETVDRGEQLVAVARRRLHQRCGTAEGNDAYIDVRRAILDECLGCALCRGDPVGVDITG